MSWVALLFGYPKILRKMTTTTDMGVTGSSHTMTFQGRSVRVARDDSVSVSPDTRRGFSEGTTPFSQKSPRNQTQPSPARPLLGFEPAKAPRTRPVLTGLEH